MATYKLYAANSTVIITYGQQSATLNIGIRRTIQWPFIIAGIQTAIIGADLIAHYGLLIDLEKKKIDRSVENNSNPRKSYEG